MIAKFFIGFCGAAYTLYTNLGGALPGMGESTEIKNLSDTIADIQEKVLDNEELLKREEEKLSKKEIRIAQFAVMERSIDNQRDDWNKEMTLLRKNRSQLKKNFYFQGSITYVLLGGFFASILAQGTLMDGTEPNVQAILTAVFIGAGWTSVISNYMQKGEYKDIKIDRDNKLIDLGKDLDKIEENTNEKKKEFKDEIEKRSKETLELANNYTIADENLNKANKTIEGYKKSIDSLTDGALKMGDMYDDIIEELQEKVKEGEDLYEKFKDFKETHKDNPIMKKLTDLGFPLLDG